MCTASDAEVAHEVSEGLEAGQGEVDDEAGDTVRGEASDTVGGEAGDAVGEEAGSEDAAYGGELTEDSVGVEADVREGGEAAGEADE